MEKLISLSEHRCSYNRKSLMNNCLKNIRRQEAIQKEAALSFMMETDRIEKANQLMNKMNHILNLSIRKAFQKVKKNCFSASGQKQKKMNVRTQNDQAKSLLYFQKTTLIISKILDDVMKKQKREIFDDFLVQRKNQHRIIGKMCIIIKLKLLRKHFRKLQLHKIYSTKESNFFLDDCEFSLIHRPSESKVNKQRTQDDSLKKRKENKELNYDKEQQRAKKIALIKEVQDLEKELREIRKRKEDREMRKNEDSLKEILGEKYLRKAYQIEEVLEEVKQICSEIDIKSKHLAVMKQLLCQNSSFSQSF